MKRRGFLSLLGGGILAGCTGPPASPAAATPGPCPAPT
ncbi:MAG: hypothetical protein JWP97_3111, partial [Labilithrix sp.]|nr:hypothetical protein [Labilithrix sp.]